MENKLNSPKTGKHYHRIQKIPYIVQMFITYLRNWIIPFKLSRLLVTHDDQVVPGRRVVPSRALTRQGG